MFSDKKDSLPPKPQEIVKRLYPNLPKPLWKLIFEYLEKQELLLVLQDPEMAKLPLDEKFIQDAADAALNGIALQRIRLLNALLDEKNKCQGNTWKDYEEFLKKSTTKAALNTFIENHFFGIHGENKIEKPPIANLQDHLPYLLSEYCANPSNADLIRGYLLKWIKDTTASNVSKAQLLIENGAPVTGEIVSQILHQRTKADPLRVFPLLVALTQNQKGRRILESYKKSIWAFLKLFLEKNQNDKFEALLKNCDFLMTAEGSQDFRDLFDNPKILKMMIKYGLDLKSWVLMNKSSKDPSSGKQINIPIRRNILGRILINGEVDLLKTVLERPDQDNVQNWLVTNYIVMMQDIHDKTINTLLMEYPEIFFCQPRRYSIFQAALEENPELIQKLCASEHLPNYQKQLFEAAYEQASPADFWKLCSMVSTTLKQIESKGEQSTNTVEFMLSNTNILATMAQIDDIVRFNVFHTRIPNLLENNKWWTPQVLHNALNNNSGYIAMSLVENAVPTLQMRLFDACLDSMAATWKNIGKTTELVGEGKEIDPAPLIYKKQVDILLALLRKNDHLVNIPENEPRLKKLTMLDSYLMMEIQKITPLPWIDDVLIAAIEQKDFKRASQYIKHGADCKMVLAHAFQPGKEELFANALQLPEFRAIVDVSELANRGKQNLLCIALANGIKPKEPGPLANVDCAHILNKFIAAKNELPEMKVDPKGKNPKLFKPQITAEQLKTAIIAELKKPKTKTDIEDLKKLLILQMQMSPEKSLKTAAQKR